MEDAMTTETHLATLPDPSEISRIDSAKQAHGWYARIYAQGAVVSKLFSDRKYGSTAAALVAAVEWRDAIRER
jgi:hypothetical protein